MHPNFTPVSVIMSAYQASAYIGDAIESVLQQTYPHFELIILDDASTDNTVEIIESHAKRDARIKLIKHSKNIGFAESMNKLLTSAQFDWVFVLDADDRMLPNRIERQLHFIETHPRPVLAGALCNYIDTQNRRIAQFKSPFISPAAAAKIIEKDKPVWFPVVALHLPTVLKIGSYRNTIISGIDTDLYSRLANAGLVLCQQEVLGEYRKLPQSTSVKRIATELKILRWISASMRARRLGAEELSFESFLEAEKNFSLSKRLFIKLKDTSAILFKYAIAALGNRQYIHAIFFVILCGIIWPPTLWWRIRNRKVTFS